MPSGAVMGSKEDERRGGLRGRLERLPLPALLTLGAVLVLGTSFGGFYAYETWDYVQHDNDFCFSCHLMQEPFELFAQSAHRGLGCKACHQPNMVERSQMGFTGVVFDPDSISIHAEVPNQLCADCHIEGDPEKWRIVASSAGHRAHFESEDPALEGLQCVECHSTSLHEFAATDRTCAQSGCHTDSQIQLGAMSDLTIHCAACHGFSTPVTEAETDAALAALAPNRDTCLSCHAMRVLVELPDPDPHEASCASCHNPHEQATPAEAAQSCTSAQCHSDPAELTPFHEGLSEDVAVDCLYCHQAHDFSIDGSNCLACHQGILDDDPGVERRSEALGVPAGHPSTGSSVGAARVATTPGPTVASPAARALEMPGALAMHSWGYPLPQELDFRHSQHADVDCASCHESTEQHGELTVTTVADCRSCHHADEPPVAGGCASCHESAADADDPHALLRTFALSTGTEIERSLDFEHAPHEGLDCASCHTDGTDKSATAVDCASCHEDHHEPEVSCMSCHVAQAGDPHRIETAHVTCSGAGCHQDVPFEGVPRTRDVCLVCHQDQVDHRPDGVCADCHAMPDVGRPE